METLKIGEVVYKLNSTNPRKILSLTEGFVRCEYKHTNIIKEESVKQETLLITQVSRTPKAPQSEFQPMDKLQTALEQYKANRLELEAIQAQIKELQNLAKTLAQKDLELEASIDAEMQEMGEEKALHHGFTISYRKSSKTVVTDESVLPEKFFKVTKLPILTDIKKAIEAGEQFAGAEIVECQNIQIKY